MKNRLNKSKIKVSGDDPSDFPLFKMKAYIDRIEDGKTAVVIVQKAGQLFVPANTFPFEIHDGMHLTLELRPNPEPEMRTQKSVKKLRERLLKKSQRKT